MDVVEMSNKVFLKPLKDKRRVIISCDKCGIHWQRPIESIEGDFVLTQYVCKFCGQVARVRIGEPPKEGLGQ